MFNLFTVLSLIPSHDTPLKFIVAVPGLEISWIQQKQKQNNIKTFFLNFKTSYCDRNELLLIKIN